MPLWKRRTSLMLPHDYTSITCFDKSRGEMMLSSHYTVLVAITSDVCSL